MNAKNKHRITQCVLIVAALSCGVMSWFWGVLYYSLYWKYRNLFYDNGRYYEEMENTVYTDDYAIYLIPTLFFLFLTIFLGAWWWKRYLAFLRDL